MKSLILASIIVLSIGIMGIEESFAGESPLNMRLVDEFGNSKHFAIVDQEIFISNDLANRQDKIQPFTLIVQIKDDTDTVVHLSWFTDSLSVGEISSHLISWVPSESGSYTITRYLWESLDSPISLEQHVTMTMDVLPIQYYDHPESSSTSDLRESEITFVLYKEIIYDDEGIAGIVTSSSNEIFYYDVVDSNDKSIFGYYRDVVDPDDLSSWSPKELRQSSYGRSYFETTTNILSPGEYTAIIFNENTKIKKNHRIGF
ncbi:MAG: hypothetical protein J4F36_12995 [Nitrosopumilaceae archaeon]|nr:hypothetical protein [Nitrosopumilaceae archaeon]